jgi:hypothetical protein
MTMLDRRQMMIGGSLMAVLPFPLHAALPVPADNRLCFDIVRKGSTLGTHEVTFAMSGDRLTVTVAVNLVYKILGVTLYRYTHRATEIWEDGRVIALHTTTDDNGEKYQVSGKRGGTGLVIEGTKAPRYTAPANALPATHWNQSELDGPWINTQDGRLMHPKVTPGKIETIPADGGRKVIARRFSLSGDVQLDMWYDDRLGWTGLRFSRGGSVIRYERQL